MRKHPTRLKKKAVKGVTPRAGRLSKKEIARREALKEWYFSLDEDAQIREIENLSFDDLHLLAWASTYENYQKGNWLT
jgi:hypothetical protein